MAEDGKQPLYVPRESLISRLEERRQEAEDARQKSADEAAARRQSVLEAVGKLTDDQVANLLNSFVGLAGDDLVKWVEEKIERGAYVSEDVKPTAVETTLEKLIRVLNLATNKEIEVYPTDPLYSYL